MAIATANLIPVGTPGRARRAMELRALSGGLTTALADMGGIGEVGGKVAGALPMEMSRAGFCH